MYHKKQARYQPVTNCTYWPVLGSYNNCNIIHITPKLTPFESFDDIHQVVIDCISDHMASSVQSGKYFGINTSDTSTNGFMLFNSYQRHIRYKRIQKLTNKLFLLVN